MRPPRVFAFQVAGFGFLVGRAEAYSLDAPPPCRLLVAKDVFNPRIRSAAASRRHVKDNWMTKRLIPVAGQPQLDALAVQAKANPAATRTLRCRTVARGRLHQLNYIRDLPPQPVMEHEADGLLGDDLAPNASEALLAAFGSCLATGIHAERPRAAHPNPVAGTGIGGGHQSDGRFGAQATCTPRRSASRRSACRSGWMRTRRVRCWRRWCGMRPCGRRSPTHCIIRCIWT